MVGIAERVAAAVAVSDPVMLDALGAAEEIRQEAHALASDPYAPFVAAAFAVQLNSTNWDATYEEALLEFIRGLADQRSYLALREAVDVLLADEQAFQLVASSLHDRLLPTQALISGQPLLAGLRLGIALEVVARTSIAPYRLLDLLTASVEGYPDAFNDPLARAIGVAGDIWVAASEQERFATTLSALASRGSEDASYEGAVHQLRVALTSESKGELLARTGMARDALRALAEQVEGREDAAAFAQTCDAILAFDQGDQPALAAAATAARHIAQHRALHSHGMHQRPQTIARHGAELAWSSLAWRIETASMELENDAFLDTWVAVDAIIDVYNADRRLESLGTISSLIRPRIVNEIARSGAMVHQLERAVEVDRGREVPALSTQVYELLDLVHRARSTNREATDDPEEPSPANPDLLVLLGSKTTTLLEGFSTEERQALGESARQVALGSVISRPTNDVVDRLSADLFEALSENESFTGTVRSNFSLLVVLTLRFLVYVGDNKQPYTRVLESGDDPPLEVELQKHFHQFLSASELAGRVGMEHSNIASGRADVITTFDGAQRYITEVKREFRDVSKGRLETVHLAQALEYQSTNQPLGQLMVLDLADHSAGTPHLTDSIWVVHRRDDGGRITSSAVISVVRGNRPTPSAMT